MGAGCVGLHVVAKGVAQCRVIRDLYLVSMSSRHSCLQPSCAPPAVCEVCGVFIQSTDNEARRRDHIEGKQYLGWKVRSVAAWAELLLCIGAPWWESPPRPQCHHLWSTRVLHGLL